MLFHISQRTNKNPPNMDFDEYSVNKKYDAN